MSEWQTNTGLTEEEFIKLTRYCNASDNTIDNGNRARILGLTAEGVGVAPGAIIRLRDGGGIGRNTFIGLYCYINGKVTIGENCLIGPHCSLPAGTHAYNTATDSFSARSGPEKNFITIGDGTWLASGCMVMGGVNVGRCNLICANSVVTEDTPDYAIMAGTPARQVGRIDRQTGAYVWLKSSSTASAQPSQPEQ
jgi:acetyltransferase-like isoleucine patch superfamily enzyme